MDINLPEDYFPSMDEPYMSARQLEFFRLKLVSWREHLLFESGETLNKLKKADSKHPDPMDTGSLESDITLELSIQDRSRKLVKQIDEALKRIDDGTYGFCKETGNAIGIKRLNANPTAPLCVRAQERYEKMEKRRREIIPESYILRAPEEDEQTA
jgi:DnaK suppressor protein